MGSKFNLNSLLNTASKNAALEDNQERQMGKVLLQIMPISVNNIVPSKDNFYSVEQIEELKQSIEMLGIKQNLIVRPIEDGKYKLIAGHRRRLASLALVEEGKTEFEFVPCTVEPGNDEILERLLLIATNATVRQLSDWEKIEQVKQMRALLEEYKKSEKLPGRIRDLIAQTLGTSSAQIGRMDAIDKNLSQEFKEELKEGGLNISTAYELSGLPKEKQAEAYEEFQEKGGLSINDAKQKKDEAKEPPKEINKTNDIKERAGQQPQPEPQCGFNHIGMNPCNDNCDNCQANTPPKPPPITIYEALRKMSINQMAEYLAHKMISAFEWDIEQEEILKWLESPMREEN